MSAHVVVVHDDLAVADQIVAALRMTGYEVTAVGDPMLALDMLDAEQPIEVLVTRVRFAPGKPNGITLARMALVKRPGIKVLFTAWPEFEDHAEGLGEFLATPFRTRDVVNGVQRLLIPAEPDPKSPSTTANLVRGVK